MISPYILEMKKITKEFPGVTALSKVDLQILPGEVHALVGENGAGKSTLIKVLSGVYPAGTYDGEIIIDGQCRRFHNIHEAEAAGIAVIYQELALIKEMDIGENIFLGNEPVRKGFIDWDKLYFQSIQLLNRVKLNLPIYRKIKDLGVGQQQLVAIAKALSKKASILVLDEPTAALTESETKILMDILRELKSQGVTSIYISHRISEVFQIADRVTVLRDGNTIGTRVINELTEGKIIEMMVGREIKTLFPRESRELGTILFSVRNLCAEDPVHPGRLLLKNISFEVKKGEILGISGLMGAGRTELVTSIFGAFPGKVSGAVYLEGRKLEIKSPLDAIRNGLGFVSEDRKRYGLILKMGVMENITLASLQRLSRLFINQNQEILSGQKYVHDLTIKTPSLEAKTNNLSGGNQQKVVLAKWLMTNPKVLFLDEPTRGIDVGAKVELYHIMNELARQGLAVIMISSELPEILGMSDRILVMHQGSITGELPGIGTSQEQIMQLATGG
jgi:ABC-type sugar transport system ATPase subunit